MCEREKGESERVWGEGVHMGKEAVTKLRVGQNYERQRVRIRDGVTMERATPEFF